jgi:hypothetical protein
MELQRSHLAHSNDAIANAKARLDALKQGAASMVVRTIRQRPASACGSTCSIHSVMRVAGWAWVDPRSWRVASATATRRC